MNLEQNPEPQLVDPRLTPGADLLSEGRQMARAWRLGQSLFMTSAGVSSEAEYKKRCIAQGRITQHAHIGFRKIARTIDAMAELYDRTAAQDVRIDRFGMTLDWSMGYPADQRTGRGRGTGIILTEPEDFARITDACPAATHFGDFMLGLPGSLDNTKAAIAAGVTSIGNLGQYFTFRMPYWSDDVQTTEATVKALGLIAAQQAEILVHSNLDDGYAGLFRDLSSAFGMVLIEKYIVEELIGASASFCFGHHFSDPLTRAAFLGALAKVTTTPGTMLFGNTVSYTKGPVQNYASLASYLLADIVALNRFGTGHAINPVPVTENQRIPDMDEILDAQLFAGRLQDHAGGYDRLFDFAAVDHLAEQIQKGGQGFAVRVLAGLADRGVDTTDPAALMLAIRRLGAKRLEQLWGSTSAQDDAPPALPSGWALELDERANAWADGKDLGQPGTTPTTVVIGTTDVHEHGAYLVIRALTAAGVQVIDAGTSIDPEELVQTAVSAGAEVLAISTYNGMGVPYVDRVMSLLAQADLKIPVLVGGLLNQIPENSNSSLPVDATKEFQELGAVTCQSLDDMLTVFAQPGRQTGD